MTTSQETKPSARIRIVALLLLAGLAIYVVRWTTVEPEPTQHRKTSPPPTAAGDRFKIPVTASQPSKGNPEALVTLIEWSDLRCARCASVDPIVDAVMKEYGDRVRLVWRNYPKEESLDALLAAEFAMEAHTQAGKFWQARELLSAHAERLTADAVLGFAKLLQLDERAVKQALDQHSHGAHLANDGVFAQTFGVTDLPAFFVNGVRLPNPLTSEHFRAAIEAELPRARAVLAQGVAPQDVYAELTKNGLWKFTDPQKLASGL